jgi:hypothetical protein
VRAARLTEGQQAALRARILRGPDPERDGVSSWTRADIADLIEHEFGHRYHVSSLRKILRALGFSRQKTRSSHPNADRKAQAVVIDGDPVEARVEVLLHPPHQVAGEAAQIVHLDRILRRHDEPELMAVLTPALDEGAAVRLVLEGGIGAALLAVARDAVAFEIAQMRVGRLAGAAHLGTT